MLVLIGRIPLVLLGAGLVGAAVAAPVRWPSPLASGLAPALIAGGLLFTVHHGYLAARALRWRLRRRREAAANAALAIPADVPRPRDFPGVELIDDARPELLRSPPDYQGTVFSRGVKVAVLPALAVLLAAMPNARQDDQWWVAGAAAAEILALVLVLILVGRARTPTGPWVESRTRAELMRREQFLRLAHVGPYLGRDDAQAGVVAAARVAAIAQGPNPARLLPLRDPDTGRRWIDELWSAPAYGSVPQARSRAQSYLYYRLDKQIVWFTLGVHATRSAVSRIATAVRVSLLVGIAVGLAQLVLYVTQPGSQSPAMTGAIVALLVLPPFSAFLMAIQELYSYRGLAASYEQTLQDLRTERAVLGRLIEEDAFGRELPAFVLHVEALLTAELQSWILITQREEYQLEG